MEEVRGINIALINKWVANHSDLTTIEQELMQSGMDQEMVLVYLKEFRKTRNNKRQFKGFIILGIGAFLGFLSCVLTLLTGQPGVYNYTLYGLTSVALVLICLGLYFIFE